MISFRFNLIHLYVSIFVCSVAFYRVYDCMMFLSRSGAFNAHRNVTISGVGLQNLGLCSASSTVFEREGSLSCHSCVIVWHQPTYTVSSECPSHIYSPLRTGQGYRRPILTSTSHEVSCILHLLKDVNFNVVLFAVLHIEIIQKTRTKPRTI